MFELESALLTGGPRSAAVALTINTVEGVFSNLSAAGAAGYLPPARVTYRAELIDRLPLVAAELSASLDVAARTIAESIADRAKAAAPVETGRLRDSIHVERVGRGKYAVVAGDHDVFYGHLVEFGAVSSPAQPFLVPAVEATEAEAEAVAQRALVGLSR